MRISERWTSRVPEDAATLHIENYRESGSFRYFSLLPSKKFGIFNANDGMEGGSAPDEMKITFFTSWRRFCCLSQASRCSM